MAKTFTISILTSIHATHVQGHYGLHAAIVSSPTCAANLNIIPTRPSPLTTLHLGLPPYTYSQVAAKSPYYAYSRAIMGTACTLLQSTTGQPALQPAAGQLIFNQQQANQLANYGLMLPTVSNLLQWWLSPLLVFAPPLLMYECL